MKRPLALFSALILASAGCATSAKIDSAVAEAVSQQKKNCELNTKTLLKPLEGEVKQLKDVKSDLEAQATASQERIQSMAQSNKQLSAALAGSKGEMQTKIKEMITQKDELLAQKDELTKKLSDQRRVKIAVEKERESLRANVADLQEKLAALEGKLAALDAAREKAEQDRKSREGTAQAAMNALAGELTEDAQAGKASTRQAGDSFELMLNESLLFDANSTKLTEQGAARLDRLGSAIAKLQPFDIRIEGHSDNAPLPKGLLGGSTSHWDSTTARAVAVARYLHEKAGLNPHRLTAASRGEFHPQEANSTPEGRLANRRILLYFSPSQPE